MDVTYLPNVTHIIPLTTIRRERRLPVPGNIVARVNEKVQAQDVIAEAELAPEHFFLDIARGLGVPEREVGRFMTRERGERIEAGDLIAGPVGIARRTVRAPSDGRIVAFSDGRVLFESRGAPFELLAGFPGTIVSTDGSSSVVLETTGALVQGVWGNGRQDYGVLRFVADGRDSRLESGQIDLNLRGAVVAAGTCDDPAPLQRAAELSIRGLILGGMPSLLLPIARRLPYPVVILDGFGDLPMDTAVFNLLDSNAGREVSVDGRMSTFTGLRRPEVIIPLPATQAVDLPDELIPLTPGVRVRVVRAPYFGTVGIVREVLPQAVRYPSGIRARSALVDLEAGDTVGVPIANLEILQ